MKHLLLLPFLILTYSLFGQDKTITQSVFTATFLEPGISYEFSAAQKTTIKIRAAITATPATDIFGQNNFKIFPRPMFGGSIRQYYNFERREDRGLNTARNSANYVALLVLYATKPFNSDKIDNSNTSSQPIVYDVSRSLLNMGLVWGLQRNYKSHFSLDLNLGLGYVKADSKKNVSFIGEFTLGFWLGKQKKD